MTMARLAMAKVAHEAGRPAQPPRILRRILGSGSGSSSSSGSGNTETQRVTCLYLVATF